MLIEFSTKNYKSFVEEARFSMIAAPKQKGLDYSLHKVQLKNKVLKGLSSSVIYGPNASGKTNLVGAMDVFRSIVLRGNIHNAEDKTSPNQAAFMLELIPNNQQKSSNPVHFSVKFYEGDILVQYHIALDLGTFLDREYKRKVLQEELIVNEQCIFQRSGKVSLVEHKNMTYFSNVIDLKQMEEIANNSLQEEELFLTNGFKLIVSSQLGNMVLNWFSKKFMVIYRADSLKLIKRFVDPQENTLYVEKTTDKAAKMFGINSNAIGYVVDEEEKKAKLCSFFKNVQEQPMAMSAELFESYGTIRFIHLFPLVMRAMKTGGTLIVDEFDASIHPMALMSIINVFHNDDINIYHAQLIFNTHNPIFLNSNLFRRDEIKFVERDDDSHESTIYALSDFKTSGKSGVRMREDYMKNYFIDQYGAIKNVDFLAIFEEIMGKEGEDHNERVETNI